MPNFKIVNSEMEISFILKNGTSLGRLKLLKSKIAPSFELFGSVCFL